MELGALCFGFGLLFAWCIFFIYFLVCLVWLGFVSFHCVYREATTMIAICKKGNAFEVHKHTARSCSCSSVCVCACVCVDVRVRRQMRAHLANKIIHLNVPTFRGCQSPCISRGQLKQQQPHLPQTHQMWRRTARQVGRGGSEP